MNLSSGNSRLNSDQTSLEELVEKSGFCFEGTVEKINTTNIPSMMSADNYIIVRIDDIYNGPTTFEALNGKQITVQLNENQKVNIGEQLVFFTNGWLYGQSIAVLNVGYFNLTDREKIKRQVFEAIQKAGDKKLLNRVVHSELVLVGKVTDIMPADPDQKPSADFDDPQWLKGDIRVSSTLKGTVSGGHAVMFTPSSPTAMWIQSPKLQKDTESIFILTKSKLTESDLNENKGYSIPETDIEGYTALDPLDVQPIDQLDRITRLINASGNKSSKSDMGEK